MMKILWVAAALLVLVHARTRWYELDDYSFERYVAEFNKQYSPSEYQMRRRLFEDRLHAIKQHNADESKTWKEGVNHFTAHTEEEFRRRLGLMPHLIDANQNYEAAFVDISSLPSSKDWRDDDIITAVKNQGDCGSCWTFGTAETVEAYWAQATGELNVLSEQQILDCTPNPHHCGGSGGCGGGTAELAMARIIEIGGLTSEWRYPYLSYYGQNQQCHFNDSTTAPFAKLSAYKQLPSNTYEPMLEHVALKGPLAISVAAGSWASYETGVYQGCNGTDQGWVLDHEVQLVGYGTDAKTGVDYWLVRNSWSPAWGEDGYIRVYRSSSYTCGTDTQPSSGDGCSGGPSTIKVCGECGILYDGAYPIVNTR